MTSVAMKYSAALLLLPMLGLVACKPQPVEPAASAETSPAPAAEVAADYPAVLQAAGTEPFWGVRVDGAALAYTTPDTKQNPRHFVGVRELQDGALRVQGGEGGNAFRLTLKREPCSDGMSDLTHPYTAEFVLGTETLRGCARDPALPVQAP